MYAFFLSALRSVGLWLAGELFTPAVIAHIETVVFDELKKAAKRTSSQTDDWVLERVQLLVDPKVLAEGLAATLREKIAGPADPVPPVAEPVE